MGPGSTAAHALDRIGDLLGRGELRDVVGIPTSQWAEARAAAAGIPLSELATHPAVDLSIDGADEVDPRLNLVKGRGGSLLRVHPAQVKRVFEGHEGCAAKLRAGADVDGEPFVTDNGNYIVDLYFEKGIERDPRRWISSHP